MARRRFSPSQGYVVDSMNAFTRGRLMPASFSMAVISESFDMASSTVSSCGLSTFLSGSKSWSSAATYRCFMSWSVIPSSLFSEQAESSMTYATPSSWKMLWYP